MTYLEESQAAGRHIFPDLARAWALFGIALVNVGVMAWPMMEGYHAGGLESGADRAAFFGVNALFLMKSYSLFSFMFGVGFAYQMQSAERRGVGFSGRYWRRIIGLLFFGAINIAFLFQGDILVMYAILGSILFLFRKSSASVLRKWGIGVYIVQVLVVGAFAGMFAMGMAFAPEEMGKSFAEMEAQSEAAMAVYGEGTFVQSIAQRATEWGSVITFGMLMQGIGALAFFLLGFAAVRNNSIADPSAPVWKRSRRIFLPIGLVISAAGAWLLIQPSETLMNPQMMFGMFLIALGSPFSTFGYLGIIAKWSESPAGPIKTFFARGGTASLTAYLMQGLLLSVIFNNYGLGFFAELGAAACIGIALGVALFTVAFASLWRTVFSRGPLEYILRGWTYMGSR